MSNSPEPTLSDGLSYDLWLTYVELKIANLTDSISPSRPGSEGHVFSLFRAQVEFFLAWVKDNSVTHPPDIKTRRSILFALDELAGYLRFYETGIQGAPLPLIEHVVQLFGRIESRATILLRPQNAQTFETVGSPHGLQQFLRDKARVCPPNWDPEGFYTRCLEKFPNIHVVSFPKYLGIVFLFYPLIGHEIGHILYSTNGLADHSIRLSRKSIPGVATDPDISAQRRLHYYWTLEFYCDLVGQRIYGHSYMFALRLMLSLLPSDFELQPFDEYVKRSTVLDPRFWGNLISRIDTASLQLPEEQRCQLQQELQKVRELVSQHFQPALEARDADVKDLWVRYPSPRERLVFLLESLPNADILISDGHHQDFFSWYTSFRRDFRPSAVAERSRYSMLMESAKRDAGELFRKVEPLLPALPDPNINSELEDLLSRISDWIPPCETLDEAQTGLRPARWEMILLAAWIHFLDLTHGVKSAEQNKERAGWPTEWIGFIYQTLDMNALYRSFWQIKTECIGEEREYLA